MHIRRVFYFKCALLFSFYDLKILLSRFIATLFCLYLYSLFFKKGMEGRRSQGHGTSRGRSSNRGHGARRVQEQIQKPREERGATVEPQPGFRGEGEDQVATAIQQMTNILARLVEQQGQAPINQPRDPEIGHDKALELFQKFSPPKFLGGSDPEVVERWLEAMINIFATLNYTEERQVNFTVFQFEGPARTWWNVFRAKWG